MEQSFFDWIYFLHCPGLAEAFLDVLLSSVPIWLAVMIGLVIGWSWRPRWTGLLYLGLRSKLRSTWTALLGFEPQRFWLTFTAFSVGRRPWSRFIWKGKDGSPTGAAQLVESGGDIKPSTGTSQVANVVVEKDLEHLLQLIENKGGKMEWQSMMGHSTSNLTYQAWRHDLEFPFFCSDREYIIGRRIWEARNTYYCVTKGVPYPALQRCEKPRRVDLYFSSWVIKPVQGTEIDGKSALETKMEGHPILVN